MTMVEKLAVFIVKKSTETVPEPVSIGSFLAEDTVDGIHTLFSKLFPKKETAKTFDVSVDKEGTYTVKSSDGATYTAAFAQIPEAVEEKVKE